MVAVAGGTGVVARVGLQGLLGVRELRGTRVIGLGAPLTADTAALGPGDAPGWVGTGGRTRLRPDRGTHPAASGPGHAPGCVRTGARTRLRPDRGTHPAASGPGDAP